MEKKKQNQLPKDFLINLVNLKESLKDVVPVEWVKKRKKIKKRNSQK